VAQKASRAAHAQSQASGPERVNRSRPERVFHTVCFLLCAHPSAGAYRLYKDGLGYNIQETIKNYYQDGEDAYYMEKVFALCDKLGSLPSQSKQSESSRQQQRESSGQQTRAMSSSKGGADQFALPRLHQQEPAQAREPAVVQ